MSDLDPKGLEAAARQITRSEGQDPDWCNHGSGSLTYEGIGTFECHQRAWEVRVPKAAAAIHAYLDALAKEVGK